MSYGGEIQANALLTALLAGDAFEIPNVDLSGEEFQVPDGINNPIYQPIARMTTEDLTTREVGGSGVFDALMETFSKHIKAEYDKGRITGADYTKAYIELSATAMSGAVSFLMGRDQAYWTAALAQINAITAKVALQTAKIQAVAIQLEAQTQRANYALTKLKLSTEDATYGQAKYTVDNILPVQKQGYDLQNQGQTLQNTGQTTQNSILTFQLTSMLPAQLLLTKEQMEAARAQTSDMRTDGASVLGSVGKQKDLYTQQITSYQRDAEVKAAKLFTDAWITQKTIDEGLLPPDNFANASLNTILGTLKSNNGLG